MLDLPPSLFRAVARRIPWQPHQDQLLPIRALTEQKKRFIWTIAGRRWGKSDFASVVCAAAATNPDKRIWIVSPTYDLAMIIWEYLVPRMLLIYGDSVKVRESRMTMSLPWGTTIQCKSCEKPVSLLGRRVDLVIWDEFATTKSVIFSQYLEPALTESCGTIIGISTPRGHNHAYDKYCMGQEPAKYPEHWSMRSPTWRNPHWPRQELTRIRREVDLQIFRQEYGAEFVIFAKAVFPMFDPETHVIDSEALPPIEQCEVWVSVDPGLQTASIQWWLVDRSTNRDYLYKEMVAPDMDLPIIGEALKREEIRLIGTGSGGYTRLVCDIAGNARDANTGRSFIAQMHDDPWNYQFTARRTSLASSIMFVRGRLRNCYGQAHIFFSRECTRSIHAMENYHFSESGVIDEPVKDGINDHSCDTVRYFEMAAHSPAEASGWEGKYGSLVV